MLKDDISLQVFLGKILGELYRVQEQMGICKVGKETIYGLTEGFEGVIERELKPFAITKNDYNSVVKVLDKIFYNKDALKDFKGYYDIEPELEAAGIDRSKAIRILTFFNASGGYNELIRKMDSSCSPGECRKFEID